MEPADLELLKKQVLLCDNKDEIGLNDFQKLPDQSTISIPYVGISRFRLPISFQHPFGTMNHDVEASMSVELKAGKTGINMSRLCQILQSSTQQEVFTFATAKNILARFRDELRDSSCEELLHQATLKFDFSYPVQQKSLKSNNWGWQYYHVLLTFHSDAQGEFNAHLTLHYEYSSTCPCSLSMAKQYERDYQAGRVHEGNGIGVAHGQRSQAKILVSLTPEAIDKNYFFDDLVQQVRLAIPTETQSLVKRMDEQAFAILNGSNPVFVEHVAKRLWKVLNNNHWLKDWIVQIEHFESLHSHNAAAVIAKGIAGGFKKTDLFS